MVHHAFANIRKIYTIEPTEKDSPPEERYHFSQQEATPVIDRVTHWL
ncbi:MAG: hypothetical protein KZQ89_06270 [Candidatus Thiodiazotropha sp. (ex Lucinoma kastoroae)]|nr:hypothetical protein [Candidatus Thiodiazotropha sp. (ex Rostrolucina anterorostrata)]MCU7847601.1 hypothetical protein [Candidatus Thiodiazotropha sp. (ex Lucinoma kastoroae)]MCU7858965.1 hypothetical protein [Candidatus Thiodiazotropha sp. (ex Lucinoma kastoroae)]